MGALVRGLMRACARCRAAWEHAPVKLLFCAALHCVAPGSHARTAAGSCSTKGVAPGGRRLRAAREEQANTNFLKPRRRGRGDVPAVALHRGNVRVRKHGTDTVCDAEAAVAARHQTCQTLDRIRRGKCPGDSMCTHRHSVLGST